MSYIWIKYSPYSDGREMTDNINDFTKVHTLVWGNKQGV